MTIMDKDSKEYKEAAAAGEGVRVAVTMFGLIVASVAVAFATSSPAYGWIAFGLGLFVAGLVEK